MTKKVVIAAAGKGTRMLHLTRNKSKHLIKVNKKPFLSYLLDNLLEAGYRDFILVVGYKEESIREFLKEYNYKAKVVNQFEILGEKEYGTACPLKCVKDIIKEDFLFVCGDNLYSVEDLKIMNGDGGYNYVGGLCHKNPEKYGVLISGKDNFLKEIVEKPKKHVGNMINAGIYKLTPEVFEKVPEIKKSSRGEYEITDVINLLAKENKVKIREIKGRWLDFGNPGDIIKASLFLRKKKK
ncbi:MAG: sugar phosphate nucleotidyltransferase [Candidatus Paceibacterota bacterium]